MRAKTEEVCRSMRERWSGREERPRYRFKDKLEQMTNKERLLLKHDGGWSTPMRHFGVKYSIGCSNTVRCSSSWCRFKSKAVVQKTTVDRCRFSGYEEKTSHLEGWNRCRKDRKSSNAQETVDDSITFGVKSRATADHHHSALRTPITWLFSRLTKQPYFFIALTLHY